MRVSCRPDTAAVEFIPRGAAPVVTVSDAGSRRAMRILFTDTDNLAEGAGAAALAEALQERDRCAASGSP
jgi:threonine dehydratase